jgi:hypothetical protein
VLTAGDSPLVASGAVAMMMAVCLSVLTWITAAALSQERPYAAATCSLALTVAMPLPNWWNADIYLGGVSPNVWHNPTGVLAMPFAVGYFLLGLSFLDRPGFRTAALTGLVGSLSLLAKPNYFLAFAPLLGLASLSLFRRLLPLKALALLAIAFIPPALVLGAQFLWLANDTAVIYAPFEVWLAYARSMDRIAFGVLLGVAFPICVAVCFLREINRDRMMILAWLSLEIAILTYICFAERGVRLTNGNFGWGMIYANHVLFVASAALLFRQPHSYRRLLCFFVLAAHAISGIDHLLRHCRG